MTAITGFAFVAFLAALALFRRRDAPFLAAGLLVATSDFHLLYSRTALTDVGGRRVQIASVDTRVSFSESKLRGKKRPVLEGPSCVGSLSESALTARALEEPKTLERSVADVMEAPFPIVEARRRGDTWARCNASTT